MFFVPFSLGIETRKKINFGFLHGYGIAKFTVICRVTFSSCYVHSSWLIFLAQNSAFNFDF